MSVPNGKSLRPRQFFHRELSKIFWLSLGGFLLCFAAVLVIFYFQPEASQELMQRVSQLFAANHLIDENGQVSFLGLFFNNLRVTLLITASGILPFLFLPGWILAFNALFSGAIAGASLSLGFSAFSLAAGLLPHGIFEIPAICLGAAMGIYLCKELIKKLIGRSELSSFGGVFLSILRLFLWAAVPLLLIAALVEAYVTPLLMGLTL